MSSLRHHQHRGDGRLQFLLGLAIMFLVVFSSGSLAVASPCYQGARGLVKGSEGAVWCEGEHVAAHYSPKEVSEISAVTAGVAVEGGMTGQTAAEALGGSYTTEEREAIGSIIERLRSEGSSLPAEVADGWSNYMSDLGVVPSEGEVMTAALDSAGIISLAPVAVGVGGLAIGYLVGSKIAGWLEISAAPKLEPLPEARRLEGDCGGLCLEKTEPGRLFTTNAGECREFEASCLRAPADASAVLSHEPVDVPLQAHVFGSSPVLAEGLSGCEVGSYTAPTAAPGAVNTSIPYEPMPLKTLVYGCEEKAYWEERNGLYALFVEKLYVPGYQHSGFPGSTQAPEHVVRTTEVPAPSKITVPVTPPTVTERLPGSTNPRETPEVIRTVIQGLPSVKAAPTVAEEEMIEIPAPRPNELATQYVTRLHELGFTDVTEVTLPASEPSPAVGPGQVVRTAPAIGTRLAPSKLDELVTVTANPSATSSQEAGVGNTTTPGEGTTAPGVTSGCGLTPPRSELNLKPLEEQKWSEIFPFSMVLFAINSITGVAGEAAAPEQKFYVFKRAVGSLAFLDEFNEVFVIWRAALSFLLTIGVALWLWRRTLGQGG